jgi:hypothetical protein
MASGSTVTQLQQLAGWQSGPPWLFPIANPFTNNDIPHQLR